MKEKVLQSRKIVRFRQFQNDSYSAFRSLKVEVTIGVLSVAMLTFATPDSATAQVVTSSQSQEKLYELEEVEVTSSRAPLTLGQSARMVTVLDREAIAAAPAQSVNDLLKIAAGVDVRQRGPIGAQTDISVRGGTNEEITLRLVTMQPISQLIFLKLNVSRFSKDLQGACMAPLLWLVPSI